MDQVKTALKSLEQAVLKLEDSVHAARKQKAGLQEKTDELKAVLRTAYERLDNALKKLRQGEQGEE